MMPKVRITEIIWSVNQSMTSAEFDAYAISAKSITSKPEVGTVVLANGQKRHAEYMVGNITPDRYLSYRTPAGHWRRANAAEEATFTPET